MKKTKKVVHARVATPEEVKSAFVYCRSASIEQKTLSRSLENQLIECVSKAFDDGYLRCDCVVEVVGGYSNYQKESKRLKKTRKMVRSQRIKAVYVTNLDRFTRDMRVLSELLSYFEKYQIKVNVIN